MTPAEQEETTTVSAGEEGTKTRQTVVGGRRPGNRECGGGECGSRAIGGKGEEA